MRFRIPAIGARGNFYGVRWQRLRLGFWRAGCYAAPDWATVNCRDAYVTLISPIGMN